MRAYFFFLFLWLSISPVLFASEEKINIKIDEIREEVPGYRTFRISAFNPFEEPRTILGKFVFDTGEECKFYLEINPQQSTEVLRHCRVRSLRANYRVSIEKIYSIIAGEEK